MSHYCHSLTSVSFGPEVATEMKRKSVRKAESSLSTGRGILRWWFPFLAHLLAPASSTLPVTYCRVLVFMLFPQDLIGYMLLEGKYRVNFIYLCNISVQQGIWLELRLCNCRINVPHTP